MTTDSTAAEDRGLPAYPKTVAAQASCTGDTWILVPDDDCGTVAVVDEIAHRIWALCDGTNTPEQITDLVTWTTGHPISDVPEFLEQLQRVGLLTDSG
ncbi:MULTISPECIES: PqqD family protein [unclassified Nocardia]|uniref:PqqD family protein n=1 Tax=unclassified Nocardia TaxID=2637762 RepID=UPI00278BCBAE|nr:MULTISPECIES: PqqD family protein [unclassified Nocardia]